MLWSILVIMCGINFILFLQRVRTAITCGIVILYLSGCLHTPLSPRPALPGLLTLNSLNSRPLRLEVTSNTKPSLGHQFLFLVIPFGRISLPQSAEYLYNQLFEDLVVHGARVTPLLEHSFAIPKFKVEVLDINETAYDFIFIRWIRCSISVRVSYSPSHDIQGEPVEISESTSTLSPFAFRKELQQSLSNTVKKVSLRILPLAGIIPKPSAAQ